jgi:hypothetical protein
LADFGDIAAVTKPQQDPNTILTKKTIKDVIHKIKRVSFEYLCTG